MQPSQSPRSAKLADVLAAILDPATLGQRGPRGRQVCEEVAANVARFRDQGRPLSDGMKRLLGALYREALDLQGKQSGVAIEGGSMAQLRELFDRAHANGLDRPSVTVKVDGMLLAISRAGDGGSNPGALYVKASSTGVGAPDEYQGKVGRDGVFRPSAECDPTVPARLQAFARDPAGIGAAHGLETGICCFCNRGLRDPRSLEVGYGPICAKRYGLPHGTERRPLVAEAA